jgi:hypothetical protein
MKTNNPDKTSLFNIGLAALALLAAPANLQAQIQPCYDTNVVKFLNPPNVDGGLDVMDSRENDVLADDFLCTSTGPISDIHLWGSWLNNLHGTVTNFWIGIYSDVPAVTNFSKGTVTPSHPGLLLWQQPFSFGQYAETPGPTGQEYFYNPTNNMTLGGDTQAWYYCFYPTNPFVQQGTAANPTNYWLAVRAQLLPEASMFGWKSSLVPYHDAAVWGTVNAVGLPNGDWQSMTNPLNNQQIDLSFKLETPSNSPPPVVCIETNGVKYDQEPNLFGGLDVWNSSTKPPQVTDNPWWLADDFHCTNTGPITDIHLWGSWQNDAALPGSITFQLYVFDDVPVGPNNSFSHPGTNVVWHQTFTPGSYAETIWANNAQENFFDPGSEVFLGPDTLVWYYCFNPTNLVQTGTAARPTNYWLAAFAELPAGIPNVYGWKTTASVRNDISVHSPWLGFGVPPPNAWVPNYQPGPAAPQPFDMAFKLTTPTNQCVIPYACPPTIKTVPCGSAWTFDPPIVGTPPCCPNPMVLFSARTNFDGCTEVATGTWVILDCSGVTVGVCTQIVTIIIPPPIMNCTTNKSVMNGSAWMFDPPTATNACSGTSLPVTVVNTVTNGSGPCNQTYTRTWKATNSCGAASYCSQTVTNICTPVMCVESDFDKYAQWPNILGGYDIWNNPYVLADDFVCSNTSPVSDIHLWGSWNNDQALHGTITFWLGIYDDVPVGSGNQYPYSHPGTNLLWQQWFAPGQYAETIWTANASEHFFDPGQSNIIGTDSIVWYYCFYPTNAFMQLGTAKAPKTYWLAAYAQLPAGTSGDSGWKTATNVLHDTSVHAIWPGVPPTNNPGWAPTVYKPPTGGPATPLDLAFKLTTCGPLTIRYVTPTNVVVTWLGGGHLQSATNVAGPYVDVPLDPPSPYMDYSVSPTNKFYRLRCYP